MGWTGRQDSNGPQMDCPCCKEARCRLQEATKWISNTCQCCSRAHLLRVWPRSSSTHFRGFARLPVGNNWAAPVLACSGLSCADDRCGPSPGRLLQAESAHRGARYHSSCTPGRSRRLISIWMKWHLSTLRNLPECPLDHLLKSNVYIYLAHYATLQIRSIFLVRIWCDPDTTSQRVTSP